MLALMSMLSAPAIAGPCCGEALKCTIDLEFSGTAWEGTITGDINGELQLIERPAIWIGPIQHYFEDFVITIGEYTIEGPNRGVWNSGTLEFKYTGLVTKVTGEDDAWDYLVGWKTHGKGDTSDPFSGDPFTAEGTMVLVPP